MPDHAILPDHTISEYLPRSSYAERQVFARVHEGLRLLFVTGFAVSLHLAGSVRHSRLSTWHGQVL
jgi:hypothetical protein